eukprot:m.1006529 g.1006529  ORF g.1006529 m.1006529 type:complete len:66 (+) comp24055_c0_seq11:423-620(+)
MPGLAGAVQRRRRALEGDGVPCGVAAAPQLALLHTGRWDGHSAAPCLLGTGDGMHSPMHLYEHVF